MTAPQFRDRQAERIHGRLLRIGAGAAAFFGDAYRLVAEDHPFETRAHLIGHVLRELESSVRHVLAGATQAPIGEQEDGERVPARETITHIVEELEMDRDGAVAAGWIRLSQTLARFAHRSNLDPPRDPAELDATWLTTLAVLDGLLDRFEARYGDVYRRLNGLLLLEEPTKADARELINTIPQTAATLNYFFSRLTDPRWFPRLRKWMVVCRAPAPIVDEDGGTLQFPSWSAAQYLKLVVAEFPDRVAKILTELETENVRAQVQAIEICLLLPLDPALTLVPRVEEWLPTIIRYQFPCDAFFDLVIRFAGEGGNPTIALRLLDQVLTPPTESLVDGSTWAPHEDVPYDLESKAEELLEALTRADSNATIDLIAHHLERRVLGNPITGVAARGDQLRIPDYSTTWLPNIRARAPRYRGSMRGFLASYLRQVLGAAVRNAVTIPQIVEHLRARQTMLFLRIELDFLAEHAPDARDLVTARLMDKQVFKSSDLRAEYADLFAEGFTLLSQTDQESLLSWVDEDPEHWEGASESDLTNWRMRWRRNWLALIRPHLDTERLTVLDQLVEKLGPPEPFRHVARLAEFVGPESPVDVEQLRAMGIDEILTLLRDWQPDGTPDSASMAGLGRILSEAVLADPQRFAAVAGSFADLDPSYIEGLLTGLGTAFRNESQFEWFSVLDCAEWLTERIPTLAQRDGVELDGLSIWDSVKRSVLDLLILGLQPGDRAIPQDRGQQVWTLIASLAGDEDPTPARETDRIAGGLDAPSLALNSIRPRAISAAIRFAFWSNHLADSDRPIGFGALGEVAALLMEHLDPDLDPSVAVRSVFGERLGDMIWFDREWVRTNLTMLFPESPDWQPLRRAVFDGFLQFGRLHKGVLPILAEEYEAAIQRASKQNGRGRPQGPEGKLAEHLMILYWWGELDVQAGLIPLFFAEAPEELRKEAFHFIGWWLYRARGSGKALDEDFLERLKALWDWRASRLSRSLVDDTEPRPCPELKEFGWWLASRAFDVSWSLSRLNQVLDVCGSTSWDRQVAEYLADVVEDHPDLVVGTLARIDPSGNDAAYHLHWRGHARTILAATVGHEDLEVRRQAIELVNRWIAQGHADLQDLLPPDG